MFRERTSKGYETEFGGSNLNCPRAAQVVYEGLDWRVAGLNLRPRHQLASSACHDLLWTIWAQDTLGWLEDVSCCLSSDEGLLIAVCGASPLYCFGCSTL